MILYNAPQQAAESCFVDGRLPRLRHFAHIEGKAGALVRAMHTHETYAEMIYIYQGKGIHMIGDGVYHTQAGDLLFFDAGVPHDERPVLGGALRYFCLGISHLRLYGRAANAIMGERYAPVMPAGEGKQRMETLCHMLHEEVVRNRLLSGDICRFLMLSILMDVLEMTRRHAVHIAETPPTWAMRMKHYLDAHYRENLTLEDIAEALGVSRFHMARLYKQSLGFSPMQYIINRRIGEAQTLLISTDMSIASIAETVGYENANYFSMLFKKCIGMSPSEYRQYVAKTDMKN